MRSANERSEKQRSAFVQLVGSRSFVAVSTLALSVSVSAAASAAPARSGALPAPRHTVDPYSHQQTLPPTAHISERQDPVYLQPLVAEPEARWTYLVYIVGDNNLEEYVTVDIETEFAALGSNADVQIVALADRSPDYSADNGNWTDTRLFHITQGQKATATAALATWGERNMGDPETLIEFMEFAQTYYPAEKYALVFWDHGWAWRPGQSNLDETDGDTLDLDEISDALLAMGGVDVVAFDQCLMSTIEVQTQLKPVAKATVLSEDYVGYEGFEHDMVISDLRKNPAMSAEQLAVTMGRSMTDRTVTAVTLDGRFDTLQSAMDRWSRLLLAGMPKYVKQYEQAFKATKGVADPITKDLRDAAVNIKAKVPDADIKAASQAVIDAYDAVVLYEWHMDVFTRVYGTTIYWPNGPRDLDAPSSPTHDFEYYQGELDFAARTNWDEFVLAYVNR